MQNLSQKILAEIKKQKIEPRSRFIFLAKNYGIWALAIVALFFVAIFFGTFVAELFEAEWELLPHFPGGRFNFVAHTLPIFWLVAILAAGAFTFFLFRKTKCGYRFGVLAIVGSILVASVAGGFSLLSTSLPPKFHDFKMQNFPPRFDEREWQNPSEGFLFGTILEIEKKILLLDSLDEKVWEVDISVAKIPPEFEFEVGDKIRAIGRKIDESNLLAGRQEFAAELILPEKPPKMREKKDERKTPMRAY